MAIGRISGSMLKSNLTRNGVDLAFETNILYLDVTNSRVGIGTSSPSTALQVNGTTTTTGLVAGGLTYPTADGTPNQVLVTNGTGTLSFTSLNSFAGITFVGDDSSGSTINTAETLKFTGSNNITTAVVDDTVTITGSKDINVNSISSTDSTAIQINDAVNVSGLLTANAGLTINNNSNTWLFGSDGTTTLPAGGTITEGVVTSNPTIQLTPATPTVASQKLVIKGGGTYSFTTNGININYYVNTGTGGDTLIFYLYSNTYADQTLYWWIYPVGVGMTTPDSGTVVLSGNGGNFSIGIDSDAYEFTVRVSPEANNYNAGSIGVESGLINADAPPFTSEHHLHLTTGNLTETSIFLGTDDHNVRTTTAGNIQITTPNTTNNVWEFGTNGALTFPDSTIQNTAARITVVGDDSTGVSLNAGETIKIAGAGGITTAVSGDVLTITGANQAQGITFVGDDSTGTRISDGETLKIAGNNNITAAMSGDILTITGSKDINVNSISSTDSTAIQINDAVNIAGDLSMNGNKITNLPTPLSNNEPATKSYVDSQFAAAGSGTVTSITAGTGLTASPTNPITTTGTISLDFNTIVARVVGDDSSGTDLRVGETVKIAGAGGITTAVSGDTLTITGANQAQGITVVGDDSSGTRISDGETLQIAGSNNITTAMSGDILTITGSKDINVNSISSGDSSAIQINDNINVSGTFNAKTIVTNDLISEDSTAINVLDGMNVSGTLSADVLDVNEISSSDSSAIQINDSLNASGTITAASFVTHGTSGNITGVNNIEVNQISSNDSTAVQVADGLNVSGTLTAPTFVTNDISSGDSTAIQINDAVNIAGILSVSGNKISNVSDPVANQDAATKNYVDTQLSAVSTSFYVEDGTSTIATIDSGDTLRIIGSGGITTAVSGDTLTITGANQAEGITFFDDASTSTAIPDGGALQITSGEGISTSILGNVITITNTSTQLEIDGGSAYSVYNAISEALIDGGTA